MLSKIFLSSILFVIATAAPNFEACKEISMELKPIIDSIDVKDRFLRSPEEYKAYADKCEAVINCFKKNDFLKAPEVAKKLAPCHFYIFYNRDFSTCAHKLIAKKDDKIPCLNTLFNDIHEPEVDQCDQWDGLQPCIKEQIGKLCDEKSVKEYVEQEKNIRVELCEED